VKVAENPVTKKQTVMVEWEERDGGWVGGYRGRERSWEGKGRESAYVCRMLLT
jgi:hypothetical protein